MKSRAFWSAACLVVLLVLGMGTVSQAQAPVPERLSGIISDYTPLNSSANPTGPYEMRGHWSLHLNEDSGKADFSAVMAMELSDYWVLTTNANVADTSAGGIRGAHTHHITLVDASVTYPSTGGIEVSGPVTVTANGTLAPFSPPAHPPSYLTVDITGGKYITYSNFTMTFTGPATGHFGSQQIHGVVRFVPSSDADDWDRR
ncbi:MAG: hypothetical protein ACRD5M_16435 [Candidatus Acidiferrales bacterium]